MVQGSIGIAGWNHVGNIRIWRQKKGGRYGGASLLGPGLEHTQFGGLEEKREDAL